MESARALNTTLRLVHVCGTGPGAKRANEGFHVLTDVLAAVGGPGDVPVILDSWFGRVEDVLTKVSATSSRLVIGSRGSVDLAGLVAGSSVRGLLSRVACPVLVVTSTGARRQAAPVGGVAAQRTPVTASPGVDVREPEPVGRRG